MWIFRHVPQEGIPCKQYAVEVVHLAILNGGNGFLNSLFAETLAKAQPPSNFNFLNTYQAVQCVQQTRCMLAVERAYAFTMGAGKERRN